MKWSVAGQRGTSLSGGGCSGDGCWMLLLDLWNGCWMASTLSGLNRCLHFLPQGVWGRLSSVLLQLPWWKGVLSPALCQPSMSLGAQWFTHSLFPLRSFPSRVCSRGYELREPHAFSASSASSGAHVLSMGHTQSISAWEAPEVRTDCLLSNLPSFRAGWHQLLKLTLLAQECKCSVKHQAALPPDWEWPRQRSSGSAVEASLSKLLHLPALLWPSVGNGTCNLNKRSLGFF